MLITAPMRTEHMAVRACPLTADKSIQSDSQLDKYGSDKINGNIRGSVSDCVAACTKEVQKRCLKEKKNAIRHTEKRAAGEVELPRIFLRGPGFLSECDGGKREHRPPLANPAKAEMIVIIGKRDADTGQCQGTNIRNPADINAVYNVI